MTVYSILVWVIVAIAAIYMLLRLYRTLSGKGGCGQRGKQKDIRTSATTGKKLKTPFPMASPRTKNEKK
jgi:hypothetical protein